MEIQGFREYIDLQNFQEQLLQYGTVQYSTLHHSTLQPTLHWLQWTSLGWHFIFYGTGLYTEHIKQNN